MSYLARATTRRFRFGLMLLLPGMLAWAQTVPPQVSITAVKVGPTATPLAPGENAAAVRVMSTEGSGGGSPTDSVPSAKDAVDAPHATTVLTPASSRAAECKS